MPKGKESYDDWKHRESLGKQKIMKVITKEIEIHEKESFDMDIKLSEKELDSDDDHDYKDGYHITLMIPLVFHLLNKFK
jgi:hypothetical protein